MKVTIVIPVYNEALSLAACLEAIANQSVAPHEVIVVDNNSTDDSVAVASAFDFVTLVREPRQGVVHARTTGFDLATGEIIARIDADSIVDTDWISSIITVFEESDIDAVSGTANYYSVAYAGFFDAVDLFFRRRLSQKMSDHLYLWGANMAMRRSAWELVRPELCSSSGIHEDFDIAIHLQELGGRVGYDERLSAQVSSRRVDMNYFSFLHYIWMSPRTYAAHEISPHHMFPVIALCAVGYFPARFLYEGYDIETGRFSFNKLFASRKTIARVDPTTNVA